MNRWMFRMALPWLVLSTYAAIADDKQFEARTPLFDAMERNTVVVTFLPESAVLPESGRNAVTALMTELRDSTRSMKVAVAAWSDKPFPEAGARLEPNDVELARQRADAVIRHARSLAQYRDIEVVNMARRENSIARFFDTNAAKVKAAFDGADGALPWVRNEADVFRSRGGPGKVVVIAYDEAQAVAH
jgi:hypothetical protein